MIFRVNCFLVLLASNIKKRTSKYILPGKHRSVQSRPYSRNEPKSIWYLSFSTFEVTFLYKFHHQGPNCQILTCGRYLNIKKPCIKWFATEI